MPPDLPFCKLRIMDCIIFACVANCLLVSLPARLQFATSIGGFVTIHLGRAWDAVFQSQWHKKMRQKKSRPTHGRLGLSRHGLTSVAVGTVGRVMTRSTPRAPPP